MKERKSSILGTRKHLTIAGWILWALSLVLFIIGAGFGLSVYCVGILSVITICAGFVLCDLGWKKLSERDKPELILTFVWWGIMIAESLAAYITDNGILKIVMFGILWFCSLYRKEIYHFRWI